MIAACPRCSARYRVDPAQIGSGGARLRCAKCQAVFRVRAPADAVAESGPVSVADQPSSGAAVSPARATRFDSGEPPVDRDRLVIVADSDPDSGKRCAAALADWGLQPIVVHDGVEAILAIQRMLPRIVVLDAALPKMYGFQVCEIVKRNESLRHIKVVLVAAIHDRDRYRRPPAELYGADAYLERPDLPEGLVPYLKEQGFPLSEGASGASETRAAPAEPSEPVEPPSSPALSESPAAMTPPTVVDAPATDSDVLEAESDAHVEAMRLARIIVSDIILYNPEKFEQAVRAGNVVEMLDSGLEEGRAFFRQRVPEPVRSERDFLVEELLRVARERGMK